MEKVLFTNNGDKIVEDGDRYKLSYYSKLVPYHITMHFTSAAAALSYYSENCLKGNVADLSLTDCL